MFQEQLRVLVVRSVSGIGIRVSHWIGRLIEWTLIIRAYAHIATSEREYAQKLQRVVGNGTAGRGRVADQSFKEARRS